jgi:hypothetical protein
MQRTELLRKLRKGGWKIEPGGKHGMVTHPLNLSDIICSTLNGRLPAF